MKPTKKIWDNLSHNQKKLWTELNWEFNNVENYPLRLIESKLMTVKEREVIAHNLALIAIWRSKQYMIGA